MDKSSYLKELKTKLRRLPSQEIDAAIGYYEEYFDEAGKENEQQVIKQLGPPSQVATKIMADFAIKDFDTTPISTKKNMTTIWLIILAILSAPISLPILAVAIALIFSIGAVILSIVFAIVITVISIIFGGIVALISGFSTITEHWPTAILFIGIGMTITGLGIFLFPFVIRFIKTIGVVSVGVLAKLFEKIMRKRKGNN